MLQLFAALQMLALNVRGRLRREEDGATAVEYGIMVALIAVAIIITVGLLGDALDGLFAYVQGEVEGATP